VRNSRFTVLQYFTDHASCSCKIASAQQWRCVCVWNIAIGALKLLWRCWIASLNCVPLATVPLERMRVNAVIRPHQIYQWICRYSITINTIHSSQFRILTRVNLQQNGSVSCKLKLTELHCLTTLCNSWRQISDSEHVLGTTSVHSGTFLCRMKWVRKYILLAAVLNSPDS
jgi:hypothetical protein